MAPLPLRLADEHDLVSRLVGQKIDELAIRGCVAHDKHGGDAIAQIVLSDERLEHLGFDAGLEAIDRIGLFDIRGFDICLFERSGRGGQRARPYRLAL